ncbi:MAG: LysR family transcriptional regulator [Desulfovibrionales bacterium]|nr:LysR family transcriptional regulator [Desulfovibrionales bacterium]
MNFRQLELFLSLAKTPNISVVAKEHFLTQSAVSVAIKGLEQELSVQLFDRLNRRLSLNSNGRLLLQNLEPVMENFHNVLHSFEGDLLTGILKVGASSTIADYILPQILFEASDTYKQVTIETLFDNPKVIIEKVEHGEIDLGLVEQKIDNKQLVFTRLCEDDLIIVSTDEKLAQNGPYTIEDLLDKKWILREQGAGVRDALEDYMGPLMNELNIVLELDHTESIKRVLHNPNTISCMSPFAIQTELDNGEIFPIEIKGDPISRYFYSVTHKVKYRTRLLDKFEKAVASYLDTDKLLYRE